MAKKNKKTEDPDIPMSIMGLTQGRSNIAQLARNVNERVVGKNQEKTEEKQKTKPEPEETPNNTKSTSVPGRPKKRDGKITKATGNNDWDIFLEYVKQYEEKRFDSTKIVLDTELHKFFARMKPSLGNTGIQNIINAVLRVFVDKHKDKIVEMITSEMTSGL